MSSLGIYPTGFFCLLLLFSSFWPWEKDSGELKKSSLEIPASPSLTKTVRVALFYEKSQVRIAIPGPYEIRGFPSRELLESQGTSLPHAVVRADPSGIRMGAALYPVTGLRITSKTKEVQIENRKYHNAVEILKNPAASLTVVNEIDVEDYLKGVLPWESNPEWPKEALKAQAVVSRTYAIFKNIENQDFPFTLSSDVGSQVYSGKSIEHPLSNQAVDQTRGEILTYRGKIFPAFFHSTCGGGTTRADYQWKIEAHPSLKGVECPFCQASKYYAWKAELSVSEVQRLLAKKGYALSDIQDVTPEEPDDSGRPRFLAIRHAAGTLKLSANEFRLAVGPDRIRSTRIKVAKEGDRLMVKGRGWGHGVGMCQFGAKHLAELGYRYADILRYYYPGSEIRQVEDFVGPEVPKVPTSALPPDKNIFKRWYGKLKSYVEDL